tara:strand:- start:1334 stop:1474 length:141 start_codon:yes stop_codon:yes gene_type:complete
MFEQRDDDDDRHVLREQQRRGREDVHGVPAGVRSGEVKTRVEGFGG